MSNNKKDILEYLQCMVSTETPTPPRIVNDMLDLIPKSIWEDDSATVLCPACKDGIFLREAALRMLRAKYEHMNPTEFRLKQELILKHILQHRLFGIAVSYRGYRVTKRTLYTCNDKFEDIDNIFFDESLGRYVKDKDGAEIEKQCFHFIENQKEVAQFFESKGVKDMYFDVIIGNPPYQLMYGTPGKNAFKSKPIYQDFITQAIALNPGYISMIVPDKWTFGTKELESFKQEFINDVRIEEYFDFINSDKIFPNVTIVGTCYFLWNKNKTDKNVKIHTYEDLDTKLEDSCRPLNNGSGTFSRLALGDDILKKCRTPHSMSERVTGWAVFGVSGSLIKDKDKEENKFFHKEDKANTIPIYSLNHEKDGTRFRWYFVDKKAPFLRLDNLEKWKLIFPKTMAASIYRRTDIVAPDKIFTDTWLNVFCDSEQECKNLDTYFKTDLFRYLLNLRCANQNVYRQVYELVPDLSDVKNPRTGKVGWKSDWTDADLKQLFDLTEEEMKYIKEQVSAADNGKDSVETPLETEEDE